MRWHLSVLDRFSFEPLEMRPMCLGCLPLKFHHFNSSLNSQFLYTFTTSSPKTHLILLVRPCLAGSSLVATASTTAAWTAGGAGRQQADERQVFKDPQKPEIPFRQFQGKDMGVYDHKASRFRRFSLYKHPNGTPQRDRLKSPTSIKHSLRSAYIRHGQGS